MRTIGDRAKHARKKKGLDVKPVANAAQIAPSTLYDLEANRITTLTKLNGLAKALEVRLDWLEYGRGPMDAQAEDTEFELIDSTDARVAAGMGFDNEYVETRSKHAFRRDYLQKRGLHIANLVLVKVVGQSMSPTLEDGDTVMIDQSAKTIQTGKVYAIYDPTNGARIKRLHKRGQYLDITSDNKSPEFPTEVISRPDQESMTIIGRAVWHCGDM